VSGAGLVVAPLTRTFSIVTANWQAANNSPADPEWEKQVFCPPFCFASWPHRFNQLIIWYFYGVQQ
jgi:hypothetical protein